MTDRMTHEEFGRRLDDADDYREMFLIAKEEAHRARASEEAKDAQIKALADALESTCPRSGLCWCITPKPNHSVICEQRRATLRLAGRLK